MRDQRRLQLRQWSEQMRADGFSSCMINVEELIVNVSESEYTRLIKAKEAMQELAELVNPANADLKICEIVSRYKRSLV